MSSCPLRSNEVGGMIAGSDPSLKQMVFILHVVFADVSLTMEKSSEVGLNIFSALYYFVPCTFQRDFPNGVEYLEGSENIFIPPEAFLKNGSNQYKQHEYKRYKCLSKYYTSHVVGAYVYDGLSPLLKKVVENISVIWLSGLY